jgi:hypothetical protein
MDDEALPIDAAIQAAPVVAQDEGQNTTYDKAIAVTNAPEEAVIAELKPTSYDKILVARVYRKWIAVTYQKNGKKTENGFCCILIDREVCNVT